MGSPLVRYRFRSHAAKDGNLRRGRHPSPSAPGFPWDAAAGRRVAYRNGSGWPFSVSGRGPRMRRSASVIATSWMPASRRRIRP